MDELELELAQATLIISIALLVLALSLSVCHNNNEYCVINKFTNQLEIWMVS